MSEVAEDPISPSPTPSPPSPEREDDETYEPMEEGDVVTKQKSPPPSLDPSKPLSEYEAKLVGVPSRACHVHLMTLAVLCVGSRQVQQVHISFGANRNIFPFHE